MQAKVKQLAKLMRLSQHTVVYSGAGISASAVGQAALSGVNKVGWLNKTEAQPTPTHHVLAALGRAGWIHGWVQQNHDGLPQKAGFPQEAICEVHGSWYDPSNPVVKYSGSLKDDAYPRMRASARRADLVLVMGTSLGGLNADQCATMPAERSLHGKSLGTVIINLQQTEQDGKASLRVFGKTDLVLLRLLRKLGVPEPSMRPVTPCKESRVVVPYDAQGRRSETERTVLDLTDGARVRLATGHNVQGAQQPAYMHIGAEAPTTYRGRIVEAGACSGHVLHRNDKECAFAIEIEGAIMRLGTFWLDAAMRGQLLQLPVVNC